MLRAPPKSRSIWKPHERKEHLKVLLPPSFLKAATINLNKIYFKQTIRLKHTLKKTCNTVVRPLRIHTAAQGSSPSAPKGSCFFKPSNGLRLDIATRCYELHQSRDRSDVTFNRIRRAAFWNARRCLCFTALSDHLRFNLSTTRLRR